MNSERQRGESYADSLFNLFGESDFVNVEIDSAFREYAIGALEDRGCIIERELNGTRVTIYLQTNRRPPAPVGVL